MKLVTFHKPQQDARIGVLQPDGRILDLQTAALRDQGHAVPAFSSMLDLIRGGPQALQRARALAGKFAAEPSVLVPQADCRLLAPVPVPEQMRDCLVFEKHFLQARANAAVLKARLLGDSSQEAIAASASGVGAAIPQVWYQQPLYYKGNRFSVVGPDADVHWPSYSRYLDFELEWGIFIGRKGRNIPASEARDYIFGYTVFNDFSARDAQYRETEGRLGPAKGKDFDTGNAMGPCIVTADALAEPYNLAMAVRVNGEEWGRGNSRDMHHRFEDMIAHISRDETLYPGEFIGSGTVGNGCGLELDRWIKPGDIVELEVEGIGILRNRVVAAHNPA